MKYAALLLLAASGICAAQDSDSVILRAMRDELARSEALRVVDLDKPYFISYSLEDADTFAAGATLGGLLSVRQGPVRTLDVNVRVGSFNFDNTNYVLSGFRAGGSGEESPVPFENNYQAMRQALWLATDNDFKAAEESISRKRAALKNVNLPDALPDFSKAPAVQSVEPSHRERLDTEALKSLTVKLSAIFLAYPQLTASDVDFESIQSDSYLANSEGTAIRQPDSLAYFRVRARTQAPDGMPLRNAAVFAALRVSDLPGPAKLEEDVSALAAQLTALAAAPRSEDYDGPVLFEPLAAAQLFGQVLGDALKITRKPVSQPGRPAPYLPSELEGRLGARILPEWMNAVDDPTQTSWRGRPLLGAYTYDDEGVKAGPLVLIDKGVLKNFLLTRTPVVKAFMESNGRGRLHGSYGAAAPDFSNLFIQASKTAPEADLKKQLIDLCKQRGKAYGLLIRKLDYPSSASIDELRRLFSASSQTGAGARRVCPPLLVYRVYPDGREELVRGLRFRDVSTRSFRDIVAASAEQSVFGFLDSTYPFALMGAGGYVSPAAVISPGVLFDEMALEHSEDELPKLPHRPAAAYFRDLNAMGILARAILREVIGSTVLGGVMFTFVLFLQRLGKLFEILVRTSATPSAVLHLFLLAIPATFAFTIPLGVLVGTLIALSRMASDGEITAMRASGVPSRRVIPPVLLLATAGLLVTAGATLWLTPFSLWKTNRILDQLVASEVTADVEPHIFEEQFPDTVLYVGDVSFAAQTRKGPVYRWKNVFLADLKPAAQRNSDGHERGDAPRITVASEALAIPDVAHNRIQLSLQNSMTHEVGKDITQYYSTSFPVGNSLLEAQRPSEKHVSKAVEELDTVPLYRMAYKSKSVEKDKVLEARIEFHRRLSLPLACVILALLGIPLGVSSRKGGKSTAFVVTVALAFLYYMGLITMTGFAKQQRLPAGIALWVPDAIFLLFAIVLLVRLERPGDRDLIGMARQWLTSIRARFRAPTLPVRQRPRGRVWFPLVPQLVDTYVLSAFVFYFCVLLASFVLMTEVFTFFELLSDIVKNHITMTEVLEYLFFLGPKLIYDSAPLSVLVTVLITFGVLTKNNEVTAFKSCGVSVFRLAVPVIVLSLGLSGGLFAFDHYIVPDANRKQDALRNHIKGKPVQSYFRAGRKWVLGDSKTVSRFFYYKYFDQASKAMAGVNIYELDPKTFRLERWISAERARWEPHLHKWIFENGWSRSFDQSGEHLVDFSGKVMTFPEITETSDYFLKEDLESKQMNFVQLAGYIHELQQSGFDTVPLQVQFYRKFSVPLFALIMALISIPFAFLAGNRGAMAGVGISFCIAIAYIALNMLFQQVGNVNLLPAAVAAWSPDLLFTLSGLYLFTRMRS